MASIVQQIRDRFFCLHEHVMGGANKNQQDKGAADEEEPQLGLDQEKGILEVRSRGPAPPGVKSPPGGKTN